MRASGVPFDLRKVESYLPYDRFDFEIPVGENGDCWDRWSVRLAEIRQSARIIQQAIDEFPPLQAKVPKVIKVPKGETDVRVENPKGEMGYYLVSDGGQTPYRLKIRSASFSNISILPWILEGVLVPDIIAIMGSLDFVLEDVDHVVPQRSLLQLLRLPGREAAVGGADDPADRDGDRLRRDEALRQDASPGRPLFCRRAVGMRS